MKGIILAGGTGSRLLPLTRITNKHLLPVYNKPMIYYPIKTLKELGCDDILIVTGGEHIGDFAELLGDGSDMDVRLSYRVQLEAGGVAEALKAAKGFIEQNDPQQIVPVILGDNYFEFAPTLPNEETIVIAHIDNPQRYGVYDKQTNQIIEKPENPQSPYAVTGLYFYKPRTIINYPDKLIPSNRGELEITDINNMVLAAGGQVVELSGLWSDMGTFDSLLEVANYVKR